VDDLETPEMIDFAGALTTLVTKSTLSSLKLVLVTERRIRLSAEALKRVATEKLVGLTLSDARHYLQSFFPERRAFVNVSHSLEKAYRNFEKSGSINRRLNNFLARSVEARLKRARPRVARH
jgi:hypothetical protein